MTARELEEAGYELDNEWLCLLDEFHPWVRTRVRRNVGDAGDHYEKWIPRWIKKLVKRCRIDGSRRLMERANRDAEFANALRAAVEADAFKFIQECLDA